MCKILSFLVILFLIICTGFTKIPLRLKHGTRQHFVLTAAADTDTSQHPAPVKQQALFTVSPNPVKSVITIQAQQDAPEAMIHIYDTNGKAMYAMVKPLYANASTLMNIANLSTGAYILTIEANGSKTDIKLVKE